MCRGKGRCAQLAFCDPLVRTVPKNLSTKAARLNSRIPSSRAASRCRKFWSRQRIHAAAKQAQIEVGALEDDFLAGERFRQRRQVETGQGIGIR